MPPVLILVTLDECLNFRHLHIGAPADFFGNILRDIARPALGYIEADDAYGARIYWQSSKSLMMVSRSVASTSVSHHARPCRPEALGGRFKVMKSAFIGSTSRLKIFSE